jgi:tol-pal system protein YbgF
MPSAWFRQTAAGLRAAAAAALIAAGLGQTAAAQGLNDVQNRLDRMETELQTLQRMVARGGAPAAGAAAPPPGSAAAYEVRMTQLEDLIRNMTGRIEENEFALRQVRDRLDRLVNDLEFRLSQLEAGAGGGAAAGAAAAPPAAAPSAARPAAPPAQAAARPAAPAQAAPAQAAAAPPAPPPNSPGSAEQQYAAAYRLIEQRRLADAQAAFEAFLAAHRTHRLADNARYWLAETHYARGSFDSAAVAFAEAYQAAPEGEKAADNLLKLGLTFGQLRRRDDACGTFAALLQRFPNLPSNQRQRVQSERTRLNCPA